MAKQTCKSNIMLTRIVTRTRFDEFFFNPKHQAYMTSEPPDVACEHIHSAKAE